MTTQTDAKTRVKLDKDGKLMHRHSIGGKDTRWHYIRERHLKDATAHETADAAHPHWAEDITPTHRREYAHQLAAYATKATPVEEPTPEPVKQPRKKSAERMALEMLEQRQSGTSLEGADA